MLIKRRLRDIGIFSLVLIVLGFISYVLVVRNFINAQEFKTFLWIEIVVGMITYLYHILWREDEAEKFAVAYAEKKQKPENVEHERASLRASLKVHYREIIQRMEEKWDYWPNGSGEMIRRKPTNLRVGPFEPPGGPQNLETDKMHLKEFKQTWGIYSDGLILSSDYKVKLENARDSVKLALQKMVEEKGVTFANWEKENLLDIFTGEIMGIVQVELRGGTFNPFQASPSGNYGFCTIATHSFKCDLGPAQDFAKILNAVRQLPDLMKKIKDMTDAWNQSLKNRESFLTSLKNDIIERAKDVDYDDPRLSNGVCDNCKHLKDKLASLGA